MTWVLFYPARAGIALTDSFDLGVILTCFIGVGSAAASSLRRMTAVDERDYGPESPAGQR